ncbi:MAG: glycosyltransferase family 2 protein [Nitrospirota bacterium]
MIFKPCIVIPIYNHGYAIAATIDSLKIYGLPIIVIDDGSEETTKRSIAKVATTHPDLQVLVHKQNKGKGAALKTGFRKALNDGFTHALQVDADGQHNLNDIPSFLVKGKESPNCLICGEPVYDESIPKSRLYGRRITNFWIVVETLSHKIPDAMCGYRLYPLQQTVSLLDRYFVGDRMESDIDLLVRFAWLPMPIYWIKTKVQYPKGGWSNFRLFQDNARISWAHTRLVAGMITHLPSLLSNKMNMGRTSG